MSETLEIYMYAKQEVNYVNKYDNKLYLVIC